VYRLFGLSEEPPNTNSEIWTYAAASQPRWSVLGSLIGIRETGTDWIVDKWIRGNFMR